MNEEIRNAHDIDVAVGRRIREARLLAGLSQESLAAELGLTFQQVQKYERAMNRISAGRLAQVAQMTGHSVEWFFAEMDTPHRPGPDKMLMAITRAWPCLSVPLRRRVSDLVKTIVRENGGDSDGPDQD